MLTKDFLLEIGTEEIPAGYLNDAVKYLYDTFNAFLTQSRLTAEQVHTSFTPRRLVLLVNGLQVSQEDLSQVKLGPNVKIAYNEDGSLAQAAAGFLRGCKATPNDIIVQTTEKGDFIAVQINQPGLPTEQLLQQWVESLLISIPFPKKMKWGSGTLEFARPVRWLTVLWGNDILPVTTNGIEAGRLSYGNRYLGLDISVDIPNPGAYYNELKKVCVLADRQERYENIRHQLEHIFDGQDYTVDVNEGLLQTVTDLIESPSAVVGEFDPRFLSLPSRIITSTISTNQKYFSVNDRNGLLSNKFVFISNGNPEYSNLIRLGNQKVVTPRLEDAMWYYQEDTKVPLESYVEKLREVVFQAKLGTVYDKTQRIIDLAGYIAEQLQLIDRQKAQIKRTALLCKADLVTNMLGEKEFTKLQGYIGKHYALATGEDREVAEGIYEHYLPKGQNDELPVCITGIVVALADKMDTVCGIIGAGMLPTGSADPFALRRAANGVVQIIAEYGYELDITYLIKYSLSTFGEKIPDGKDTYEKVSKFYQQRVTWLMQQNKLDYDVTDSVMHLEFGNLVHLLERARALQTFKSDEDFVKLVIGFKRVSNIIKDTKDIGVVAPELFTEKAEVGLNDALAVLRDKIEADLQQLNYTGVLGHLVSMRPAIDKFFDDVLVNTDDMQVRQNRYALLSEIRKAFLSVADLSLIVVEGDKK